jgi:hypothetical protein
MFEVGVNRQEKERGRARIGLIHKHVREKFLVMLMVTVEVTVDIPQKTNSFGPHLQADMEWNGMRKNVEKIQELPHHG